MSHHLSPWWLACSTLGLLGLASTNHAQSIPGSSPREVVDQPHVAPESPARLSRPVITDRGLTPGFTLTQVNIGPQGLNILGDAGNEPSMAIDPVDPARLAVAWRQFDSVTSSFRQAGRAISRDGGRTFLPQPILEPGVFRSDPVMRCDADGRFFLSSLRVQGVVFDTQLFRSLDGGLTFPTRVDAFGGDKQWIAINRNPGSPVRGSIYQIWTSQFNRTFNQGVNWSSNISGGPVYSTLVVAPDNSVIAAGASPSATNTMQFSRSTDAGNPNLIPNFSSTPIPFVGGVRGFLSPSPNPGGLCGQVWIDVDRSTGPRRGWIYVVASVGPGSLPGGGSDPLDVYLTSSANNGQSWTPPVRVNASTRGPGDWQWFGAMSVAPNGRIDVLWNDTRQSQNVSVSRVYSRSSSDGGVTWTPELVIGPEWNSSVGYPQQNKIGDYSDIHSDNLGFSAVFAATFNNEQDVYFLRVGPRLCPGDFNQDGLVSVQDIFDFLAAWFAGGPADLRADVSRDFLITAQDIFDFLGRWFASC